MIHHKISLRKKIRENIFVILALVFILILISIFFKFGKILGINLNWRNQTTTTRPFQENVSIEVPEGVTRVGKTGRIHTV